MTIFIHPSEKHTSLIIDDEHRLINYSVALDVVKMDTASLTATFAQIKQQMLQLDVESKVVVFIVPFEDKRIDMYERLSKELGVIFLRYKRTIVFNLDGTMNSPRIYRMYMPG